MTTIRKALFVGIDYLGTSNELGSCQKDALDMESALQKRYTITEKILLLDRQQDPDLKPTKRNMMRYIRWLSEDVNSGDIIWFVYSGHGSQILDSNGDEQDGYDEVLIPVDFQIIINSGSNGIITDDWLNQELCAPAVSKGATLYMQNDCCNSGTGADLKYMLEENKSGGGRFIRRAPYLRRKHYTKRFVKRRDFYNPQTDIQRNKNDPYKYLRGRRLFTMAQVWNIFIIPWINNGGRGAMPLPTKKIFIIRGMWKTITNTKSPNLAGPGKIIHWSGSKDDQYAYEGPQGGVLTNAVLTVMKNKPNISLGRFLLTIRNIIRKKGYDQYPRLSSSRKINPRARFLL